MTKEEAKKYVAQVQKIADKIWSGGNVKLDYRVEGFIGLIFSDSYIPLMEDVGKFLKKAKRLFGPDYFESAVICKTDNGVYQLVWDISLKDVEGKAWIFTELNEIRGSGSLKNSEDSPELSKVSEYEYIQYVETLAGSAREF